jgi:hypothetical protein
VGGIDDARAHGQRATAYGVGVEELQRHATPDDVDYRIHGPDFVEGDLVRVLVVDGALRDGQTAKCVQRSQRGSLRKIRTFYQSTDVSEGPAEVFVGVPYVHPERGDTVHLDTLGDEVE